MNPRRSSAYRANGNRPNSHIHSKTSIGNSNGSPSPYANVSIYRVGDCVEVSKSRVGIIKYIGELQGVRGTWYGIEFVDGSVGSHNGVYKNAFYFKGEEKRCDFFHRSDIRRKLSFRSNSTRTLNEYSNHQHHTAHSPPLSIHDSLHNHNHEHNANGHQHERTSSRATVRRISSGRRLSSGRDRQITPTLPLPEPVISSAITVYLRCQCFADPEPIELQLNKNEVTLKELKLKILEECKNRTNLSIFKSLGVGCGSDSNSNGSLDPENMDHDDSHSNGSADNNSSITDKVDVYRMTMKRTTNWQSNNSSHSSHSRAASVRVNSLNVQSGNMAYCILKRNAECFKKLTITNNVQHHEVVEDAPMRYYGVGDGETLYVLFTFPVSIKVLFQKTLFSKMDEKQSTASNLNRYQPQHGGVGVGSSRRNNHRYGGGGGGGGYGQSPSSRFGRDSGDKLERTESDDGRYLHHYSFTVSLTGKFEELYRKIMDSTDIGNVNCIKLLSTNFIYNKSMMIEKFVYNTIDQEVEADANANCNSTELYLYFIHLYDASDSGHKRHRTRGRNYSVSSTLSAHSFPNTAGHLSASSSTSSSLSPSKLSGTDRLSALKSTHFTMNSTGSAYSSYSAYGGHRSPYGLSNGLSAQRSTGGSSAYSKVLLNFVTAQKSESYTILDRNITVKELRMNIAAKFGTECDRIKVGNEMMSDFKMVRDYALGQNEILHIYDESAVTIFVHQSGLDHGGHHGQAASSQNEALEIKLNRKLTVQHIKYQISSILRYILISDLLSHSNVVFAESSNVVYVVLIGGRYPMNSQTLIMKEVLRDNQLISECGLKNGDTVRLLYNFGKRVKKLPNQRLKVPIAMFDGGDGFEVIVDRDIFVSDLMELIESEQGINRAKQRLLFHGQFLRRDQRLSVFNVTHELHLQIEK